MGKTIYIDDGDALNIDRVIVNMPNTKWCKVLYSCDLIDEYEARLNAEKVAMLEEIQMEIEELEPMYMDMISPSQVNEVIEQKIDKLKGKTNNDSKRIKRSIKQLS